MLREKIDKIMEKIKMLDPMFEDAYGEESEEYQLRQQVIALMKENLPNTLTWFSECGVENFDYFLGYLDDICDDDEFYNQVLKIEEKCYSKVRGHNIRLNAIGFYLGYNDYYKEKYLVSYNWEKPITVDYLNKEIGAIVNQILALSPVNEEDYPAFTPEEELINKAIDLLQVDKNKTYEYLLNCNKGILAYFFLDLDKVLEGKKSDKLQKQAFNIFFPQEEFVDRTIAKKYLRKFLK